MNALHPVHHGRRARLADRWARAGAAAAAGLGLVWLAGQFTTASSNPSPQYLHPQICQPCHAEIYRSYENVAMGRSFYRPSPENLIEDYTNNNHFYHTASDRHYRMIQRGGKFYQRRYQLDSEHKEQHVFEMEVTHIMGSGNHARTYLNLSERGVLRQLPVSWYAEEKKWAMSPGYDHARHDDFRRRITHSCMFCHNAYPPLPEPSDRYGQRSLFPRALPSGIDCQRCHGAGSRHVRLASSGKSEVEEIRAAILNPARLSPERQMEVCLQCHVKTNMGKLGERVRRSGRAVYSFRAGEPLDDYIVHFDFTMPGRQTPPDRFQIDSTAHRLLRSVCFVESRGAMTCTTCHNPHRTPRGIEAVRHFRQRCVKCHPDLPGAAHRQPASSDCVGCHMPKRRAQDAVHVVMTDHLIQRHVPDRNLLEPLNEDHSAKPGEVVLHHPESLLPSERDIYLGMAQVQSPSNLIEGLGRLKAALGKEGATRPESHVRLATALLEMGDLGEAEAHLRRALEIDPAMAIPRFKLAELLKEMGKLEAASQEYRQVLNIDPGYGEADIGLGLIHKQQGQADLAIGHFRSALQSNPLLAEGQANLGTAYLQQGKMREATEHFRKALSIEPANPEVHLNLGVALSRMDRQLEAIDAFQQALALKPDFSEAHYSMGLAQAQEGRRQQALESFRQAIRHKPEHAAAHYNLGVAYSQQGLLEQAAEAFQTVVRLKPDDREAYFNLALAYDRMGKGNESIEAWSQVIRLAPQEAEAYLNLGVAYGRMGRADGAVDAFRQAIELQPDFAEAHSNLGVAYGQMGRLPEALEAFKRAVGIRPKDPGARLNLGLAYLMLGQRDSALREHEMLRQLGDRERADLLIQRISQQAPAGTP